ncbi:purine-nucleoside phosphorylase [bacterium]|nr:purine-nucleoside phosphorylase [bacterium]
MIDESLYGQVIRAGDYLTERTGMKPEIGVILGSGLGGLVQRLACTHEFSTGTIPGYSSSTVEGHAGKLLFGSLGGKNVVMSAGRVHYYEGYSIQQVTFGIRVMALLGCRVVILSNAVGGIRSDLKPGDLVAIEDHLNLMGTNPLIGPHDPRMGPRFPDMTAAYSPRLRSLAFATASGLGITLKEGVLVATSGPSYETAAEIRMMRQLGADVVGMSVIPEVIVATQSGLEVLAISCVTNAAAGCSTTPLEHDEVLATGARISQTFQELIENIIKRL